MKKQTYILMGAILSLLVLFISCSDLQKDLPVATTAGAAVHQQGWIDTASTNFHGKYLVAASWDLTGCQTCHGTNFSGGTSGKSCKNNACHPGKRGPEDCSTCHGMPPAPDVYGNTATTARGVGAHRIHWMGLGNNSTIPMSCSGCHTIPAGVYATDHLGNDGNGEVIINDALANLVTNNVAPNPTYNPATLTCNNTFCHGKWTLPKSGLASDSVFSGTVMTGNNTSPVWTAGSAQTVSCSSCHGMPPTGHVSYSQSCTTCHVDVTSSTGKTKHMNGKIDLAGGVVRNFR